MIWLETYRVQKIQKKNYDARHSDRGEFLQIGDIVVKLNMVNKNRKGGKFDKSVSDKLYIVENFIQNRNIVIHNLDTNEQQKKSVPRDQLKKIHTEEKNNFRTQDSMTDNIENTIEIQDRNIEMDTSNNTIHNMKKVEDMDTTDNTIVNMNSNTTVITNITVFSSDEEEWTPPDTDILQPKPVRQTSSQNTNSDIEITKVMPAKTFIFNPLTFQSREEIGPRVLIIHFNSIPFKNTGQHLSGK